MSWDFNYRVGGTALVPTYATAVRLIEGIAGLRSELVSVAYKHGANVGDRQWTDARLLRLDTDLAGGTPAQIFTAFRGLTGLIAGGIKTLTRADPNIGDVRTRVLVSDEASQGDGPERLRWAWPVWMLDGYWETVTPDTETDLGLTTTGTIGPFTPAGTHPTEPVFTITVQTGGSNPKVTNPANGDELSIIAALSSSDVVVIDVPARTVTLNGSRAKNILRVNRGFWMEFPTVSTTLDWTATSGSYDVVTSWRARWR